MYPMGNHYTVVVEKEINSVQHMYSKLPATALSNERGDLF